MEGLGVVALPTQTPRKPPVCEVYTQEQKANPNWSREEEERSLRERKTASDVVGCRCPKVGAENAESGLVVLWGGGHLVGRSSRVGGREESRTEGWGVRANTRRKPLSPVGGGRGRKARIPAPP